MVRVQSPGGTRHEVVSSHSGPLGTVRKGTPGGVQQAVGFAQNYPSVRGRGYGRYRLLDGWTKSDY